MTNIQLNFNQCKLVSFLLKYFHINYFKIKLQIYSQALQKITQTVSRTLGPKGQLVSLNTQQTYEPRLTKDGITVARNINFQGPEKQISQLVQQALEFVDDLAGDSTTTTSIYINELYKAIEHQIDGGKDYRDVILELQQGIKKYEQLLQDLKQIPNNKQLEIVASTASNSQQLGKLIAQALQLSPMIQISQDRAQTLQNDEIQVFRGLHLDTQMIHPYFLNQTQYVNPVVLISENPITMNQQIQDILQQVNQSRKPLIIFAPEVSGQALQTLLLNHTAKTIQVAPIRMPGYGNQRLINTMDLKILLDGKQVQNQQQMWISENQVKIADFNNKEINIQLNQNQDKQYQKQIQQIINQLTQQLNDKNISNYDKENIRMRIGKFQQKLVKIQLSGQNTEEKKDRVVDALNSVRNAMRDGIVYGGGITQCIIGKQLEQSQNNGERIIGQVLMNFVQRMRSSGVDVCKICDKQCKKQDFDKVKVLDSLTGHLASMRQALDCISQIYNIGASVNEIEDKKENKSINYGDFM